MLTTIAAERTIFLVANIVFSFSSVCCVGRYLWTDDAIGYAVTSLRFSHFRIPILDQRARLEFRAIEAPCTDPTG
jgi:hypothetical protein